MFLKARFPYEANLFSSLQGRGLHVQRSKDNIILALPQRSNGIYFTIPKGLPAEKAILLEIAERIERNGVWVVCDFNGGPMHAFLFPPPQRGGTERQAVFSIMNGCHTVFLGHEKCFKIIENRIMTRGSQAYIETHKVFVGESLPSHFSQFAAALKSAQKKLRCPNINRAHFAKNMHTSTCVCDDPAPITLPFE